MEADYYALMIGLWASDEFSDYAQCVVKYTVPEEKEIAMSRWSWESQEL